MLAKIVHNAVFGDIALIKVGRHNTCIVDARLKDFLSRWKWYPKKSASRYYAVRKVIRDGKIRFVRMHRVIAKTPPWLVCHHKNGNSFDNREANLENLQRGQHDVIHWHR